MSLRNLFVATFATALLYASTHAAVAAGTKETFTNPVLPSGPDPWVAQRDGWYYYTNTLGDRIALWKTRDMAWLADASPVTVWRAPENGPNSTSVWAPELHSAWQVVSEIARWPRRLDHLPRQRRTGLEMRSPSRAAHPAVPLARRRHARLRRTSEGRHAARGAVTLNILAPGTRPEATGRGN
jgi:hypothetical protein